jgi:type IV pilus assembly protein PilB
MLVGNDLIEAAPFDEAAAEAGRTNQPLDEVLVARNLIPDEYLGQLVADILNYPFVRLETQPILDHVLRLVPEKVARGLKVVAFGKDRKGDLMLAMHDPEDLETARMIEKKTGIRVAPHYATERGIAAGIDHYSSDLSSAVRSILEGDEREGEDKVIRVVELVMNYAYQNDASDIHIEPREKDVLVRYRIDGILHDVVWLPIGLMDTLIRRIKILSKMRLDEHFAAQDGKFQEVIGGERVDVRVSILPVVEGEKVVMRVLAEKGRRFDLEDLGLSERNMKKVRRNTKKLFGMILSCGPTGSGKTTSMYAVLKLLNTRDVNIATIEDPIEYAVEGVNQIQVNPKTGLTFASGLRSIARQDPDIIMVGEIRDEETASIAVNAAMTGHLVLSTLHTNDAATTLPRFRDMKIEPFLIASTVNVIISQRLARRICGRCIVSYDVSREELESRFSPEAAAKFFRRKDEKKVRLYRGTGCDRCGHTGYQGRIGVFEVLEVSDDIRDLIMADADAKSIKQAAVRNGMTTMFEDSIEKALSGITTVEEILRVAAE